MKLEDRKKSLTPSPCQYHVDDVTHNGKFWSQSAFMSPKLTDPEPFKTPAPNVYLPLKSLAHVKPQTPSYTFGEKVNLILDILDQLTFNIFLR